MRDAALLEMPSDEQSAAGPAAVAFDERGWPRSVAPAALAGLTRGGAAFGVLEPSVLGLVQAAWARHREAGRGLSRLTVVVAPNTAPLDDQRRDDDVHSFIASPDLLDRAGLLDRPVETWCYEVLYAALASSRLAVDIRVVHKPEPRPSLAPSTSSFEVIIPHRGLERHLRLCMDSVARQQPDTRVAIALDQKPRCARLLRDIRDDPAVRVYQLSPSPVGPYVARHHLGQAATADFLVWQDSDDISLPSRLALLALEADRYDAGIVGSHELRLHELQRKVSPVRYPLDASAGLARVGAGHQLLFPTTLVRRELFERIGGFSTNRIYSLDVNFWLTASLQARLRNVDEFLYVRRRRAGSLTMRADIGTNSEARMALRAARTADYQAVRDGRKAIADSALAIRHRADPVEFRPLTPV